MINFIKIKIPDDSEEYILENNFQTRYKPSVC